MNCNQRFGNLCRVLVCLTLVTAGSVVLAGRNQNDDEISMSSSEMQKLDTFEAHELAKADKVFAAGKYKQAAAEYDSFILQFPRSRAIPYALLRKGRSMHMSRKRYQAIKEYQDLLDYFPNEVKYAAAAKYYQGKAHMDNGDEAKAMKTWAELADDKGYSRQPVAADAINRLAQYHKKHKREAQAIQYFTQVAVDFRDENSDAARDAMGHVIYYYIRSAPNEPKLQELYTKAKGFDSNPLRKLPDQVAEDKTYWGKLTYHIDRYGNFDKLQADEKQRYYEYWSGRMKGKFADWDDFRIDLAEFRLQADGDKGKWANALDEQYKRYEKPGDTWRTIKFITAFARDKNKVREYYGKLDFSKMDHRQVYEVMKTLEEKVHEKEIAQQTLSRFPWDKMSDGDIERVAWYASRWGDGPMEQAVSRMKDNDRGKFALLRYYERQKNLDKGLPLADALVGNDEYAQQALFIKGGMLQRAGKYQDAIAAYQRADNPPNNVIKIAECYAGWGKLEQAVGQYREIEAVFKDKSPWAKMQAANLYKRAGKRPQYIGELRGILKQYPKSREASEAHQRLEEMGYKTGGAVDAED